MVRIRENHYTLSMLMNQDQVLVAYKTDHNGPAIFDRTGGYGYQGISLVMAWLQDEREWLIGDEVRDVDEDEGLIIDDLYRGVLDEDTLRIGVEEMTYTKLISVLLSKIAAEIREINPHAIIEKIVIRMPQGFTVASANKISGQLQQLVEAPVFLKRAYDGGMAWNDRVSDRNKIMWIDYDREGLHGYTIVGDKEAIIEKVISLKALGLYNIEEVMSSVISQTYMEHLGLQALSHLDSQMIHKMVKIYLPQLFKKESLGQSLKITFNHVFPPFQRVLSLEQLTAITQKYYKGVEQGLNYLKHTYVNYDWSFTGEGLRMPWFKQLAHTHSMMTSHVQWEGQLYGLLLENNRAFKVKNSASSVGDIGLLIGKDKERSFYPLIPWKEALLGFENQVELIVDGEQEFMTLVRVLDGEQYEIVKEEPLKKHLNDTINHLVLKVSCDKHRTINMMIEWMTL